VPLFSPKVEAALNAGELWKARDLLRGRIGSSPYSPDLYEQLGVVLLRMGDVPEAGKYLFLSGRREPDYEAAINLYLQRHGRHGWRQLVGSFPSSARRAQLDVLPTAVLTALEQRGRFTGSLVERLTHRATRAKAAGCAWGCALRLLALIAAGLAVAWFIVHFFYPAP
jgi:hypothetical protein